MVESSQPLGYLASLAPCMYSGRAEEIAEETAGEIAEETAGEIAGEIAEHEEGSPWGRTYVELG